MPKAVVIGTARAEPGAKGRGYLQVTSRADGSPVSIPVMLVNGTRDGPTLVVGAGCHGDEYEGMVAVVKVASALDPKALRGTFIGVPVVNIPAYEAGHRLSPIDHQNIFYVFPGNPAGSISQRIAHVYFTEIMSKADYFIDLHNGGDILLIPHSCAFVAREDEKTMMVARAVGTELIGVLPKGVIVAMQGMPVGEIAKKGITGVQIEIGGEARFREEVLEFDIRAINNVMKTVGMLEGEPAKHPEPVLAEMAFLYANRGGLFLPTPQGKDRFRKGDVLARMYDVFHEEVEKVVAPFDGLAFCVRTVPSVYPGERLYILAQPRQG